MITIKKIAEIVGVSRGTVDRVVNKRGGVDPGVEERINNVITQYNYKPNKVARALVNRHKLQRIGIVSSSVSNVFFEDVKKGILQAESELKDLGVSLDYVEITGFSVEEQLRRLDEMTERRIDALAINPVNDERIRAKLNRIIARSVPVVTFNSDIENVDRLAYIGCDYRRTGRIAAGLMAMASAGKANVAIVTGSLASLGHSLRVEGFREEAANCPGMRVVEVVEMFDDDIASYAKTRELLERTPGVDAFFFSAAGKEGGIRAIQERPRGRKPTIVTVDSDPFTRQCLLDDTVIATICQQPFVQGYEPVRQLADYLLFSEMPGQAVQYTQAEILLRQSLVDA